MCLPVQDPAEINEAQTPTAGAETEQLLAGLTSEKDMICMSSGRVIKGRKHAPESTLRCGRCRHQMLSSELEQATTADASPLCPLCHSRLTRAGAPSHNRSQKDQL